MPTPTRFWPLLAGMAVAQPCVAATPNLRDDILARAAEGHVDLTAPAMFRLAEEEATVGNIPNAITIYQALTHDRSVEIRSEARFRLAQLLAGQHKLAEAATLYRAILDEQPQAQPARLELAKILAQMGDLAGTRRLLRQAQAGGLPPDVAQVVDQYAAALRARKPVSASFELAFAPSTNVNRGTDATTLDTVFAPVRLSRDARARSGIGVKAGAQLTARQPVAPDLNLLANLSGQASLYRASSFNDLIGTVQVGVEAQMGRLRLQPLIGRTERRFGGRRYASITTGSLNLLRPVAQRAQVEANVRIGRANYRLNDAEDGPIVSADIAYERAFSARTGGRASLSLYRQASRDPGYATTSAGVQFLAWHDLGRASLYVTLDVSRLHADDRLALFPDRRRDWMVRATAGGVLRRWTVAHFAPLVRVSYERNSSTLGLYDYRRLGAEIGISRAF